jgi:hypothetical protein
MGGTQTDRKSSGQHDDDSDRWTKPQAETDTKEQRHIACSGGINADEADKQDASPETKSRDRSIVCLF